MPGREAHVDLLHRLVDLGEERARQARRPPSRWRRRGRATRATIVQRYGQHAAKRVASSASAIASMNASTRLAEAPVLGVAEEVAAGDRRHAHAHEVRGDHRDRDGERERREELLGEAGEEQHRQEHGHRRQRRGEHRQRDRVGALERGLACVEAHALVAVDRLEHDDRVVDEASHRERQPAEREGVERLPRRVEDDQRDRERERDRDRDDQRAAHALQEEQDDERDEDERLDDLLLEAVVRRADERRLIEVRLHLACPAADPSGPPTTFFTASTISIVLPPGMRSTLR